MSLIAMQGGATGTGVVTLLAPNTNTNRTLTLPDATGTVLVSGTAISGTTASFSGDVTLGSSVLATPTGTAPSYLCRAWVNFNGTGTVAIRASGNVSSITDNGVADYTVNFATAMPDANYALSQSSSANIDPSDGGGWAMTIRSQSTNLTTSCRVWSGVSNAKYDVYSAHIAFFR